MRRIKKCELCKQDINEETRYAKFKRNTLFTQVEGEADKSIWHALMPVYVCTECVERMQDYCSLTAKGKC